MVTLKMIAEACGVSMSTVSKALNNNPDLRPSTIAHVRRVAAEMGYMPNAAARALKTSRSYCFGIVYEEAMKYSLNQEYFTRILTSFVTQSEALGYDVFLLGDRLAGRAMSYVEHARYRNCDGVFIISGMDSIKRIADEMHTLDRPVVCVDYQFEGFGSVISDNAQGMRDLVNYIFSQGHRHIAFIHGNESHVTRVRLDSFHQTCRALNLRIPREYVVASRFHDPASTAEATRFLLSLSNRPTCILYPDDFAYIGGMNELNRRGLSVPHDVSVASYDGIDMSQALSPKLTTLRQSAEAMGEAAAKMLVDTAECDPPFDLSTLSFPGELLCGETVRKLN